jgi:hypothetical protein
MPTATTDTTSVLDTPFALPGGATIMDPDPAYGRRRALLSALRSNGINTLRRRRGN